MNSTNQEVWDFRIFVTKKNAGTMVTVSLLEKLCKQQLGRMCDIKVIDMMENLFEAVEEGVIATPTIIKKRPLPERRIVGSPKTSEELHHLFNL